MFSKPGAKQIKFMNIKRTFLKAFLLGASFLCLSACSSPKPEEQFATFYTPQTVDFSGHWEKNYQASDDVNSKFQLFLFDIQRSVNLNQTNSQGRPISIGAAGVSGEAITGLARLTEDITKVSLLEIKQDNNGIIIDREDNFALTCDYFKEQVVSSQDAFGAEACGWNGQQLIFQFNLMDGLSIRHQVTLGPDLQQLNITTTVSTSSVSSPFTISSYYQRYTPPEYDYECIFTLSQNNVCSQNGS